MLTLAPRVPIDTSDQGRLVFDLDGTLLRSDLPAGSAFARSERTRRPSLPADAIFVRSVLFAIGGGWLMMAAQEPVKWVLP
jgi:adenylylsulfate kinase-like enzyme